ncbi:synapsin-1-like, partial [Nothobranchius furzeri]
MAGSITTSDPTLQIAGSPVAVAGQVLAAKLPLPANSKIVTLAVPSTQGGGVQQKVLGIFPHGPPANLRTYSTLHPTTGNVNLRTATSSSTTQQQTITTAGQTQAGAAGSQSPAPSVGPVVRGPAQQGQPQQAATPGGHVQPAAPAGPGTPAAPRAAGPGSSASPAPGQSSASQAQRPQQGQVKLTMAQLMQLT